MRAGDDVTARSGVADRSDAIRGLCGAAGRMSWKLFWDPLKSGDDKHVTITLRRSSSANLGWL